MSVTTKGEVLHETITMERTYKAAPARVFNAWRDVEARERWSRPNDDVLFVYDQAEFRVGGLDISRCGAKDDLRFCAMVRYMEIIQDRRIVFAEQVSEADVKRAAALITVEIDPEGNATKLTITMQVSSFDADMHAGYRVGWTAALDNLANEF